MFTFYFYFYEIFIFFYIFWFFLFLIYFGVFSVITFIFIWVYYCFSTFDFIIFLEKWVIYLNKYFHNYIVSSIYPKSEALSAGNLSKLPKGSYILIKFEYFISLTIYSIFLEIKNIFKEVVIFFKFNFIGELAITKKPFVLTVQDYNFNIYYNTFINHIIIFYNFIKSVVIALFLSFIYIIYTVYFFQIQFLKQLAIWFIIGLIYYWLISGFNFFVKHYQFGKFTSQIQRFWKRTNTYFWLIEGFLILLFFYYFLNSSQEPLYMYDYSSLNQEYLISLKTIYANTILLSLIIYLMYTLLLMLNFTIWSQQIIYFILISVFIFFSFFIETYQFYYLLNSFIEKIWVFNEDLNLWVLILCK